MTSLAEEGFAKRAALLASKSEILDFTQEAAQETPDFDGQSHHSSQLKSLISSADVNLSHLMALEDMYKERLVQITNQVQERTFLLEEQDQREREAMRTLLKLVEDKEHEYLEMVATNNAHMAPKLAMRKDPEKVSSLPAIFPSLGHNPAVMRMGGGFSMNRQFNRTATILRCFLRCKLRY